VKPSFELSWEPLIFQQNIYLTLTFKIKVQGHSYLVSITDTLPYPNTMHKKDVSQSKCIISLLFFYVCLLLQVLKGRYYTYYILLYLLIIDI
jgi:hypothetical protein